MIYTSHSTKILEKVFNLKKWREGGREGGRERERERVWRVYSLYAKCFNE